jgi:transcriptional regulator with XRE-family HTH domain
MVDVPRLAMYPIREKERCVMKVDQYSKARTMLRKRREKNGYTLGALAKQCGQRSPSSVCEWESGSRTPTFAGALAIERLLGAPKVEDWGYSRETGLRADREKLAATGS